MFISECWPFNNVLFVNNNLLIQQNEHDIKQSNKLLDLNSLKY
jgi:hypothetical protein